MRKISHSKSAFTLSELVAAIAVIALVVLVTLPITIGKMKKADNVAYFMAYSTMQDIAANVVSQNIYDVSKVASLPDSNFLDVGFKYLSAMVDSPSDITRTEDTLDHLEYCKDDGGSICGGGGGGGGGDSTPTIPPPEVTKCPSGHYHDGINCVPYYDVVVTPPIMKEFEPDDSSLKASTFCNKIVEKYNSSQNNCSAASLSSVKSAAASGNFSAVTPYLVFQNGLRLFIGSDVESIPQLAGVDKQDRVGFVVYVDINGDKGKGRLNQDVFPFYLLVSGKVVPGYDASINEGALNNKQLSVNILADEFTSSGTRSIKVVLKNADYRKAACTAGYVKSATYCAATSFDKNTALQYDLCKDNSSDCRVVVNKPFRLF